jgi:hypothetical protein
MPLSAVPTIFTDGIVEMIFSNMVRKTLESSTMSSFAGSIAIFLSFDMV